MRSKKALQRDAELRLRTADLWLPRNVFNPLAALVRGAHRNYEEADASILNIPQEHIADLVRLIDGAKIDKGGASMHLTYLDMIELEQVSRYSERWGNDFVDMKEPGFSTADIQLLTKKLEQYTEKAFPAS